MWLNYTIFPPIQMSPVEGPSVADDGQTADVGSEDFSIQRIAEIALITADQVRGLLLWSGIEPPVLNDPAFRASEAERQETFVMAARRHARQIPGIERPGSWFIDHNSLGGNPPASPSECIAIGLHYKLFAHIAELKSSVDE